MRKTNLKKQIKQLKEKIYAKCLDCTCYQPKEVILCEIKECPLWSERPKDKKGLYSLSRNLKRKKSQFFEAKN
ncbi:MAG: hypothetical protein NC935_05730 [Candidatus Omnitrophica bacterium]|nr:hypothetical protein [Candidatus Omnitrophota bacterium]